MHTIEIARRMGIPVEEEPFALADITSAAPSDCEVFTAATTTDLTPVVRVGDHVVGRGTPGPVTLALLDAFRREQAELVGLEPPVCVQG
jgi:branched-subunit amino acid aminotransferase/4-amino-4-deoxychorismate lyase